MPQITFGPFRLDSSNRRLHRGGKVVSLRPKTFEVLAYLAGRPGRLVTKEELLATIWPATAVTDTVLKVCVREIRTALGDDAEAPRFIETAHRLGYRFIGHVLPSNLPSPVSSLIGRRHEIEEISQELDRARLVTLTGPGGWRKARLALEVAGAIRDRFNDGARWIDLEPLGDEVFVPETLAVVLGVRDQPGHSLTSLVGRFLATREVLLIIDNCEHVIGATADLLHSLLQAAGRLRVLTTSREPFKT